MVQLISDFVRKEDMLRTVQWQIAGISPYPEERGEMEKEFTKPLGTFIHDLRTMVVRICLFRHENRALGLAFETCENRTKNLCCGHPRILLLRIAIAMEILKCTKPDKFRSLKSHAEEVSQILWNALPNVDAQASGVYNGGGLTDIRSIGQVQSSVGAKIANFRDALCNGIEAA